MQLITIMRFNGFGINGCRGTLGKGINVALSKTRIGGDWLHQRQPRKPVFLPLTVEAKASSANKIQGNVETNVGGIGSA